MKKSVAYLTPFLEAEKQASGRRPRRRSSWPRSRATCTTSARTSSGRPGLQQLRGDRPGGHGSRRPDPGRRAGARRRHRRPLRPHHALAGGDGARAREMDRQGFTGPLLIAGPPPAAPTRPCASPPSTRAGRARARRLARGGGGEPAEERRHAAGVRRREPRRAGAPAARARGAPLRPAAAGDRGGAAEAEAHRLGGLRTAAAFVPPGRGSSTCPGGHRSLHRLDAVLLRLGAARTYPRIFENPEWGEKAREVFDDGQGMLERLVEGGRLKARAVYGFFPANAAGDDIELYADESRSGRLGRCTPCASRPTRERRAGAGSRRLRRAARDGLSDWIGAFGSPPAWERKSSSWRTRRSTTTSRHHGEGPRRPAGGGAGRVAAPPGARRLGLRPRGVAVDRGARAGEVPRHSPRAGYPACPTTRRSGSSSTSSGARSGWASSSPRRSPCGRGSVCGFYFAHPQARYFALGRSHDQVLDYHRRKGMDLRAVERWLAPNLDYDPRTPEPVAVVVARVRLQRPSRSCSRQVLVIPHQCGVDARPGGGVHAGIRSSRAATFLRS